VSLIGEQFFYFVDIMHSVFIPILNVQLLIICVLTVTVYHGMFRLRFYMTFFVVKLNWSCCCAVSFSIFSWIFNMQFNMSIAELYDKW